MICIERVSTDDNVINPLTKALSQEKLESHVKACGEANGETKACGEASGEIRACGETSDKVKSLWQNLVAELVAKPCGEASGKNLVARKLVARPCGEKACGNKS